MISDVAWGVFFIAGIVWSSVRVDPWWRAAGLTAGLLAVWASTLLDERDELFGWWVELGVLAMVVCGIAAVLAVVVGRRTGLHPVLTAGLVMLAGGGVVDGLITAFGDSFDEELAGTSIALWIGGSVAVPGGYLLGRWRVRRDAAQNGTYSEV